MIQFKEGECKEFIIKPNNSLSWRGNKVFFFMLFFVSFFIAISFAMAGMWLIVPFTGLEMLLLGSALTYCYLKNSQCEIVKIDEKKVSVSLIKMRDTKVFDCNRYWAKFILNKPQLKDDVSILNLLGQPSFSLKKSLIFNILILHSSFIYNNE